MDTDEQGLRTTDNNGGKPLDGLVGNGGLWRAYVDDLRSIGNRTLAKLCEDSHDLLVFPQALGGHQDGVDGSAKIFDFAEPGGDAAPVLTTRNLMGFVGRNGTHLTIASRFAQADTNDFFLHYMLQKVFKLNILNFSVPQNDKESLYDFLLYLFPLHLLEAMRQGLYKEYKRVEHNDANVKGTIDVKRHLRMNIPFAGKVAYTTREYRYDNPVIQLVRHTIEYIKVHRRGASVLRGNPDVADAVNQIEFHTGSYNRNDRQRVINASLTRPVRHPCFTKYRPLQKLCLRILRHEKLTFGEEKDKVYGILFDGAWLWEEYLNTVLAPQGFRHPDNRRRQGGIHLFENFQTMYPDFYNGEGEDSIVADAKYMPLRRGQEYGENDEKAISIYYKTITYMYRLNSRCGFLFYPIAGHGTCPENPPYKINGALGGTLTKLGLSIPQTKVGFDEFVKEMETCVHVFLDGIGKLSQTGGRN